MLLAGCAQKPAGPPTSTKEYQRLHRASPQLYPKDTIVMYNLQRVLDRQVRPADRLESMRLVTHLGGSDPGVSDQLAAVLDEKDCPQALFESVLEYLLKGNHPGLAEHVVGVLPRIGQDQSALRNAVLDWLAKHPTPEVLSEIVKLWAAEPSATSVNEPRYRRIVERITGKPWDSALLESLNMPGFYARGSALAVLVERMRSDTLADRIAKLRARVDAVRALQAFGYRFRYLPRTAGQLLTAASLFKTRADMIPDASRLYGMWRDETGYIFAIRDFHLISRLARDPLRTSLRRSQLVLELGQSLGSRAQAGNNPRRVRESRFWPQSGNLTMADLWNLYLLNDMLTRPRVQLALKMLAEQDRADKRTAWGGLVFYENGQAEARLYPSDTDAGADDLTYVPCRLAIVDGRDALCRFQGHFEKVDSSDRLGPSEAELRDAKDKGYYGLVLTSLGNDTFAAHYYNPRGVVVSLGTLPFGR